MFRGTPARAMCQSALLGERIGVLRTEFRSVRARYPFQLEAAVTPPGDLYCVRRVADRHHSSVHALKRQGSNPEDWGGENVPNLAAGE